MSSPRVSSPKTSHPNSPPPLRQLQEEEPSQKQGPSTPVIDPSLASDPKPPAVNTPVEYYHHQPQYYPERWQQTSFTPAVFDPRYRPPPPPSHHPHHYNYEMPHRVDSADRNPQPRSDDRGQYEHHPGTHPSPPPIATLHESPAAEHASLTSPSPPAAYYPPAAQNGPGMNQAAYPYPPHARYPQDPTQHQMQPQYPPSSHYSPQAGHVSTRSIRPTFVASAPIPTSAPYIIHTDDAATKLNDRIRRRCYNCRTTDTSTWRRSSLTPGKVLCNKCGLFERTHSRPRPEQFPHKRGPIVQSSFKSSRSPPPSSSQLPPIAAQMPPNALPPRHYDHPSIAPLMPRSDSQQSQGYPTNGNGNQSLPEIRNLLNSPSSQQQTQGGEHGAGQAESASEGNSLKRPHSPSSPQRSPRQEQRSPPYAYRAPATAAAAA